MDDLDLEIEEEELHVRQPRIFRDRSNPFDTLSDEQFRIRYRFTRHGFFTVLALIENSITTSDRSNALLPAQRMALTLQSLASNTFQILVGDMAGVSQATVSRTIRMVCKAIVEKIDSFVIWPTGESLIQNQIQFKALTNIPNVVGAIDGTHVRIPAPNEHEHVYVNRKSYHSLNVGVACAYDLSFIWVCCKYGGSAHDSRVFRESLLHSSLQSGALKGILLGDSAYRSEKFLLKPILNPATEPEKRYTDALCRGRSKIENAIGCAKRQFHCLHAELRHSPEIASLITTACICLRNASITLKERPFLEDQLPDEDGDDGGFEDADIPSSSGQTAMRSIIDKYFT
ncbi:unnamed protein product [Caenorhabditis brenneri]